MFILNIITILLKKRFLIDGLIFWGVFLLKVEELSIYLVIFFFRNYCAEQRIDSNYIAIELFKGIKLAACMVLEKDLLLLIEAKATHF